MIYAMSSKEIICELLEFLKWRERRTESLFEEIMAENFLNMETDMDIQVHEAQSSSNELHWRVPL